MRHEFKHRITYEDYLVIRGRLKYIADCDSHAGRDGSYRVHSLYFDNIADKVLREKIDGVRSREKFRIRYYNEDTGFIRLEKKSKRYGLGDKVSAPVTREQVTALCGGNTGFLKESEDALLRELYAKMQYQMLRPRCIVDYDREAYVYPPGNVRVTFDSNIRTGLYRNTLFDREPAAVPAEAGVIILEVKYDAFLPELIAKAVRVPNRQAASFSKYAACRIYG